MERLEKYIDAVRDFMDKHDLYCDIVNVEHDINDKIVYIYNNRLVIRYCRAYAQGNWNGMLDSLPEISQYMNLTRIRRKHTTLTASGEWALASIHADTAKGFAQIADHIFKLDRETKYAWVAVWPRVTVTLFKGVGTYPIAREVYTSYVDIYISTYITLGGYIIMDTPDFYKLQLTKVSRQ